MANDKKFVVKNGLTTQNISFVDDINSTNNTITVTMLDSDTLSFSGDSGQLFSITDSLSGTIFAVNDISGVPSIEVDDDGTIRFAETVGNVLIGTAVDDSNNKLQVSGSVSATSFSGALDYNDITNPPSIGDATITFSGDGIILPSGSFVLSDTSNSEIALSINAAAISITSSQISDFGTYLPTDDFTATANTWLETRSTTNLSEGTNLYYTVARANTAIDNRVTKTFVDNLNVDADTLDGANGSYYLDWTNTTNKPDPVITLGGDLTGSVTLTNLANGTLTATVVDDSHNHTVSTITDFESGANSAIDARVTQSFVNALNVDADTLDGANGSFYLDYTNFTNTPTIPVSGVDFDPVGTDNSTDVTLAGSYDYLTLSGQQITLNQIDYSTDITNLPTLYTTANANTDIDARVTQAFINALNVTAAGVQADSVALGTDTTGNYVATVSSGNGLTGSGSGEGSTPTLAVNAGNGLVSNSTGVHILTSGDSSLTANSTGLFINDSTLSIATSQLTGDITLGTQTSGNYVASVSGGTGVTVTGGTGEGSTPSIAIGQDVSTSANITFQNGTFTGDLQIDGDFTVSGNVVSVNVQELSVEDNLIYLNANAATANPDLGWAGGYNDGTYAHAGMFRDATDGIFKAFDSYTPEPDVSAFIDTSHGSFALADIQANNFIGTLNGTANNATNLNGQAASYYLDWTNVTNKPDPVITLGGDLTGSVTLTNLANGTLTATVASNVIGADELNVTGNGTVSQYLRSDGDGTFTWATPPDTDTTYSAGNGIGLSGTTFSVAAGSGLTQDTSGLSHSDTSSQASVNNSNGTVIQDVTLDGFGHVTGLASVDLDGRYYTETEADNLFVNVAGDTMTGDLTVQGNTNIESIANFISPNNDIISVEMLDGGSLSFEGTSGQLFSITDTLTGTIFSVNDISGIPSIEVDDDGTIRLAEFSGNVLIGTGTDDGTNKLQVNGTVAATFSGNLTGNVTGNASTATALQTARNIALTGAVTGNANFDGSGNISITTTATSDPTLTLSGDATGSATFTNLGNATLTVTVADNSHNHTVSNISDFTTGANTAIDNRVTKSFVDALNVDADTLDGANSDFYLDYTNFTNTPTIPVSGVDFDPAGTDNSTDVTLAGSYDYLTLSGQQITLNQIDYSTDISNLPTLYTTADANTDIDARVTKSFVDALNVDADTLDGANGSFYLDYNNFTNTPSIPQSGVDFDPVGTDNSTDVTLAGSYDYLTLSGQQITLNQIDYDTDITNTPNIPQSGVDFDPVGTDNSTDVTLAGSYNYLTLSGQQITLGQIDYSTDISNLPTLYTTANANTDIDARVTKSFVDALNIDADTLDGANSNFFLDYTNFTNTPSIPQSGVDFDPVGTDNSTDVTLAGSYDYLTLTGQQITLNQIDYDTDISNKPTLYTTANANTDIDARVTQLFINDLNVDADTLDGQHGSYYLNYNNFTNKPSIPQSGVDFDPVGTDNSTDVTLAGSYDYLTLTGQQITLNQIDYSTDISNLPTLYTTANANTDIDNRVTQSFVNALNINADTLDSKQLATIESEYQSYTDNAIAALANSAPAALDTLNELAAALGDDPNFSTTITNSIATKLGATASITLTGDVSGSGSFSANAVSITTTVADNSHSHTVSNISDFTSGANTAIDNRVTKTFIDNLNVDADTLDGNDSTYFTNASNLASGTVPTARLGTGTANSTTYLAGDQTWKEISGGGTTWTVKTANYTAVPGDGIVADTSGGVFTITLPSSPSLGDNVIIADGGDWATNNLTVARNGSTIEGTAEDLTLDIGSIQVHLIYDGSTWEVYAFTGPGVTVQADDNTTNATKYITWADSASGGYDPKVSSTKLTFNPSTGTLSSTDYNSLSDQRLKENIQDLEVDYNMLNSIRSVSFDWKDNGKSAYGFIAQEIEEVMPELVATNEDNSYKSVSYIQLIPHLLEAIKDLKKQVDELKEKN